VDKTVVHHASLCYHGDMDNQKLGNILKGYRLKVFPNDSLRRVAKELGVNYTYLSRLEDGYSRPSDEVLSKVVRTYTIPPNEALELFAMSHYSPHYAQILRQAKEEDRKGFSNNLSQAFFRTIKKKEE